MAPGKKSSKGRVKSSKRASKNIGKWMKEGR